MAKYSASIPTVMVKSRMTPEYRDSYDSISPIASEVRLSTDTSGCFILYPEEPSQPGEVLACEVSTYESDDCDSDVNLVLQTIADREFINVCKLISGYSKKLKIFTAAVPCTPRDAGHDIDLDSLTTRLYCRSRCIKKPELWSSSVEYVGGATEWDGGPPQLVCRKGDYKEIQMIHYDSISEIEEGLYLFHLSDLKAGVDIIWNTLPVDKKIQEDKLVIAPVSFAIVESYSWIDVFPNLKYINDERHHFKSKNKRAMSLSNYYSNNTIEWFNRVGWLVKIDSQVPSVSFTKNT